eukprot:gnl/TRDRNA2_/TRDRNA2_190474_c0_seq1.p1 gnl/TRDRNA2_/TRDRNA2_190474_c0~~gnl/TRDRNA2_/TRDRNA2_190474_c0_seq1.p1  ORF type:complete len:529 (-),score=70.40 gnl/TRDRNA2_/TRDRNA2_190474_c0_seq1:101-1513(-)
MPAAEGWHKHCSLSEDMVENPFEECMEGCREGNPTCRFDQLSPRQVNLMHNRGECPTRVDNVLDDVWGCCSDEDDVLLVHCVQRPLSSTTAKKSMTRLLDGVVSSDAKRPLDVSSSDAKLEFLAPSSSSQAAVLLPAPVVEDVWVRVPSVSDDSKCGSIPVEFIARAAPLSVEATRLWVYYNDRRPLAEAVLLSATYKLYHYDVPLKEPLWRVEIMWDRAPGAQEEQADELNKLHSLQLDPSFGVRVHGQDLISTLVVEPLAAASVDLSQAVHAEARRGRCSMLPAVYAAEAAIEFVARGLTGREQMDVFVNGLRVPCQMGIQLGNLDQPRLFRFALAPASCHLRSVVICVYPSGSDAVAVADKTSGCKPLGGGSSASQASGNDKCGAVLIDQSFGIVVAGQDCLQSVLFVDSTRGTVNPYGWANDSEELKLLKAGHWSWQGCYYLLPYRLKKKPYDRHLHPGPVAKPFI